MHGSVLTMQNLKRRGFLLVEKCLLCGKVGEDSEHLFFQCD